MNINIFNETDREINELDELRNLLFDFVDREKLGNVYFNIIIIDNERIKDINKKYRNIDKETDVISFALEDDKIIKNPKDIRILGDIYISIDKVISQSKEYGHSFKRELFFLSIHGLLHLLGYDHMDKKDEEIMFKKQKEILDYYGIIK